jgi:Protein related to penicillin acylase
VSGTLAVDGLVAPVRIVRDTWGVPHIYAQNEADLFFAQGFVQAQDRLFQMDLWRRSAQGRLSEVLGPNFIERDAMTRRMQFRGQTSTDWESYGPATHTIARDFVRGVNAWAGLARGRPPEEFFARRLETGRVVCRRSVESHRCVHGQRRRPRRGLSHEADRDVGLARARQLLPGDRGFEGQAPPILPRCPISSPRPFVAWERRRSSWVWRRRSSPVQSG